MSKKKEKNIVSPTCPLPFSRYDKVQMAHGGGGTLMHRLLDQVFLPQLSVPELSRGHDSAVVSIGQEKLAFTTDSFVVRPLFFPGGDIGQLAVHGTVNDLAMSGATPLYLSSAFILEEGLPIEQLQQVVDSMHRAAAEAGVRFITGDTKVVDKGKGDGIYINTAGVGRIEHDLDICPASIRSGDVVVISGDLGRHGVAVMNARHELALESEIQSDSAPLHRPILELIRAGIEIHCLRDLTRGGLASALVEIAGTSGLSIEIEEALIPVSPAVRGACELLGLDPVYVANEGRFAAILPSSQARKAVEVLRQHEVTEGARLLGRVKADPKGLVLLKSLFGGTRVLDMLSGEQLPRIC